VSRKFRVAVIAVAAVLAAGVAVSAAADTAGVAGTIYGCVSSTGRLVNVNVKGPAACPAGSFPVSWAATVPGPSPSPTPTTPSPTPTSPSPTPTTPSPTPTTPGPTAAWACTTSSFDGGCDFADPAVYGSNTTGASSVRNQIWGPVPGESSVMRANGLQDWQDTITVPAGNTSVTGWPDSQVTVTRWSQSAGMQPDPLTNYSSLVSTLTLASQDVPGAAYDNGFDVWGGPSGTNNDYAYEMMIWTDQRNRGTCGDVTVLGRATFGGDTYTLCRNGPAGATSEYIWYHSDSSGNPVNQTTTTVDIYAMVQWMIAQGYYPSGYGLNQVTVGSEVCSTGGVPETITLSGWTLTAN